MEESVSMSAFKTRARFFRSEQGSGLEEPTIAKNTHPRFPKHGHDAEQHPGFALLLLKKIAKDMPGNNPKKREAALSDLKQLLVEVLKCQGTSDIWLRVESEAHVQASGVVEQASILSIHFHAGEKIDATMLLQVSGGKVTFYPALGAAPGQGEAGKPLEENLKDFVLAAAKKAGKNDLQLETFYVSGLE